MVSILLFISTYIAGIFLALFHNPVFSFVLYELVYFFYPQDRWWSAGIPALSYSFYTVVLMAFSLFVIYRKNLTKNKIFGPPQFKWIYLILLLYAVAWFYSVNPDGHLQATIYFIKLIVIITIAYKLIDTIEKLDYVIWGYLFGSWYIGFLTYQTGRNAGNRVEGIGTVDSPDSNGIAAAIAPSIVLCLCYFWNLKGSYSRWLMALCGVFVANALILINSRGAFLAVFVGVAYFMFYMFFSQLQRNHQKAAVLGIAFVGILGILYLIDYTTIERIMTMKNTEVSKEQESGATRMLFWISALDMAKDHPFGGGFQAFDYHAPNYLPEDVHTGNSRNRSVHSSWFEVLTETGYLGLILFCALIYSCFRALRQCELNLREIGDHDNYFKVIALKAALLSFLVAMSFMNRARAEILYWLVLYTACAYNIYVINGAKATKADSLKTGATNHSNK